MRRSATVIALILLACSPAVARAGTYEVRTCASEAAGWAANASPGLMTSARCPASLGQLTHGLFAADALGGGSVGPRAEAGWRLTAPPTTFIRSLTIQRYLYRWRGWAAEIIAGDGTVLDTCQIPLTASSCSVGTAPGTGTANQRTFENLSATGVATRVRCTRDDGCPRGTTAHRAIAALYGATLRVEDPDPPVVGSIAGSVLDAGWHRGTDTVTLAAADASGIKSARLLVGDAELARRDEPCDYARMQPCPAGVQAAFSLDTSRVPDGTHAVRVEVTDAGGETAQAATTLKVDRHAPAAPSAVRATRADDGTYELTWEAADQGAGAPLAFAHYVVCGSLPGVGCAAAQALRLARPDGVSGVRVPSDGGEHVVSVWLEDEAGNADPREAATLTIDTAAPVAPRAISTLPPALLPSGPTPSARLKVTAARRVGSVLTLSGTIARGASARVSAQLARTRTGRALATASGKPRNGRWTLRVKLPATLRQQRTLYLTLRFAGQSTFGKATVRRRLARKAPRGGGTRVEFRIAVR